jgi:carboxylesterase
VSRVVVLHGLGGTPRTVESLSDALRAAGHDVVVPLLPGHGGSPEDLRTVAWADWLAAADCDADMVVGQSMGGALALAIAAESKAGAVVAINTPMADPDVLQAVQWMRSRNIEWVDTDGAEWEYQRIPTEAVEQMHLGLATIALDAVECPAFVIHSADDEVVDPCYAGLLAAAISGDVTRLTMPDGGHTATLGPGAPELGAAVVNFCRRHLSAPGRHRQR